MAQYTPKTWTTGETITAAELNAIEAAAAAAAVKADTDAAITAASTADRARVNHSGTQAASTITGLATVATTGAYTDLTAKPTIPASPAALVRPVTVAYAATVTPSGDTTDVLNIGALTGNLTLANPTGTPVDGQNLRVRLAQDATGSRTVTFGTAYVFGTDVTASLIPSAASAAWEMLFTWHAGTSKWRATAIVRGF